MSSDADFVVVNRDDQTFVTTGETLVVRDTELRRESVVEVAREQVTEEVREIHVVAIGMQGPPGAVGTGCAAREPISVFNGGDPQIVFATTGDVVTNDVT